jgi:sugar/nucleoside kinase (ribokinase family)
LNTTTHLASLFRYFGNGDQIADNIVRLQTVINENDVYGKLIIDHAREHNFRLVNRRISNVPNCFIGTAEASKFGGEKSTGHCAVIVANNDRSFMTHLGCIEDFRGSHILLSHSPEVTHQHVVHVAGYFNIPGFWNGELSAQLATLRDTFDKAGKKLTISLVPQQDATDVWDGGLKDVLKYVDFLILNEDEAKHIAGCVSLSENDSEACEKHIAEYFYKCSSNTYVVVTRSSNGAAVFHSGEILFKQSAPRQITNPVDPTGAGDAFAAGFLYGVLDSQRDRTKSNGGFLLDEIRHALKWGCAMGTCNIMVRGASTPCSKQNIEKFTGGKSLVNPNIISKF